MDYTRILTTAISTLRARGVKVEPRFAYYDGRHNCSLGSKAWNDSYRKVVAGVKDNQCKLVVDTRADAVVPAGVEATSDNPFEQALAAWATDLFEREADDLDEFATTAEKAGTQTVMLVDYDEAGEVALYCVDPRSVYAQVSKSGRLLSLLHVWRDEADSFTSATLYLPDRKIVFGTTSAQLLPAPEAFHAREELPNPLGEIAAVVVDLNGSVLDDAIPLNDMLNKSLQTQAVVGEAYALPFRVYLGIETYDPATGEVAAVIPSMNPATGSRDVSIPTVADAEGDKRQVIQFESPKPEAYLAEQDSLRTAIARLAHIPTHLVQLGGAPVSGDALEIASMPFVGWQAAAIRTTYRRAFREVARLAVRMHLYKLTGRPMPAPALDVKFAPIATSTTSSRVQQMRDAVDAGMSLADALVEFLGWDREAADLAETRTAEASARAFDAGTV
ncbi:phage portal protein [Modestobacter sp. KNN46-3]|uniref:phage portal protein n=1 Tax=Modestobacter sp. KNN46-3 TaxID=2711218 RepID=UPI0013DE8912|nr:phage portal protein [Modestobacter sp. KNN46-3]